MQSAQSARAIEQQRVISPMNSPLPMRGLSTLTNKPNRGAGNDAQDMIDSQRKETLPNEKKVGSSLAAALRAPAQGVKNRAVPEPSQAVIDQAHAVLDFWFALPPGKHFAKNATLDAAIADRFGALQKALLADNANGWRGRRDTLLAAVIVLDQFSRNMHRDSAEAFAGDKLARDLAIAAIELGWDRDYPTLQRAFLYLPMMHAEDKYFQALCVELFAELDEPSFLRYALMHQALIDRFERFPHRNAALGRRSTPEELAYMKEHGAGF